MQYTRYATIALCLFQGYLLALSFENPESNPFLPGIMDTIHRLSLPLVADPGLAFRILTVLTLTVGNDVFDVDRRSDHRSRNRQRHVADHHGRHRRAPARGFDPGLENFRAVRRTGEPGESDGARADDRVFVFCDRARSSASRRRSGRSACNTRSAWWGGKCTAARRNTCR